MKAMRVQDEAAAGALTRVPGTGRRWELPQHIGLHRLYWVRVAQNR